MTCGELPILFGDPDTIEQVFANLLGNAINYLDQARRGQVEVGCAPDIPDAPAHRLFVKDNGLGITEHSRAKLFQAFQRFHPNAASGVGLGLSIVKKIVDRHGGKIELELTEGAGSTFWIHWPKQQTDDTGATPAATTE